MLAVLAENPLLLLFAVLALGYPLGRIRLVGAELGLSAVLFAGLLVNAVEPRARLPELVGQLGLVLFVYTLGLASAHQFFVSILRRGWRDNLLVVGILCVAMLSCVGLHRALGLEPTITTGMFAGALTNAPALATLEALTASSRFRAHHATEVDPVVAFSVTYPVGVIGMILVIAWLQRFWKVDYAAEERHARREDPGRKPLTNRTVRISRPEAVGPTLESLKALHGWNVVFGRWQHGDRLEVATDETRLSLGDIVTVVGPEAVLDAVTSELGHVCEQHLPLDRSRLDFRRICVSDPRVAGQALRDLNLPQHLGATVTRIQRGEVEYLPDGDTILELGDRVRVVARREQMNAVSRFLGDSYRAMGEIDILSFGVGLSLGLLLGLVPIPLPGGVTLRLGIAGGPLIVALILGLIERTGPVAWVLPYNANLTLRQFGLVLFLAAVGTRSGAAFWATLFRAEGLVLILAGAAVTVGVAVATLWIGHRWLRIPMGTMTGILAGLQTQPAVLGFALEQSRNGHPNAGYATVYPVATISKIVLVQVLWAMISAS
ncbi:MAG: TrkA C-terminal domain-containing protein [Isosphaeraceae bacterium]